MAKEKSVINTKALKKFLDEGGIEKLYETKGKGRGETISIKDPNVTDKLEKFLKTGKKAGGKVMKMRGGGLATRGTSFTIR